MARYIYVPGANNDVGAGEFVDLWQGDTDLYVYPSAAVALTAESDSIEDDAGGTGAAFLRVHGLRGDWREDVEDVPLDGTTLVSLTKTFRRIFEVFAINQAGTTLRNVGTIDVKAGSVLLARIMPKAGQSRHAAFTVPEGRETCYIASWRATVDKGTGPVGASFQVTTRSNTLGGEPGPWISRDIDFANSRGSKAGSPFIGSGVALNARDDIRLETLSTSTPNVDVAGRIDFRFGDPGV